VDEITLIAVADLNLLVRLLVFFTTVSVEDDRGLCVGLVESPQ